MKHFDAIIIGSGQGGTPLAKKLAKKGWNVALIEKQWIGGACVNVGCTPTKTMIASAKSAYDVKHAGKLGVNVDGFSVDIKKILDRKNEVVKSFRNGAEKGLEETENLTIIYGTAAFISNKSLKVSLNDGGEAIVSADKIFINVGTSPQIPEVHGLTEVGYYTSTTLMELQEVPEHLLIIGGGYIGLEFGQMYRRFGSKVTILESGQRFLEKEDEDIAEEVLEFLRSEDIEIRTNAKMKRVESRDGEIKATIIEDEKEINISCTHILIAAGRTPNTKLLDLQNTNIKTNDRGYIDVNDKLETAVEGVYVIGDVKGGPEFTHIAYNDHLILLHNLFENTKKSIKGRMVPYTMFTDPQLGRVGSTEQEAKEKGLDIKVALLPMDNVARAIENGDTRGVMKAVVDAKSGKILGVAILGQEGGEIMSVLQMAMVGGITGQELREMVFAHPLYAESINNLFMKLYP